MTITTSKKSSSVEKRCHEFLTEYAYVQFHDAVFEALLHLLDQEEGAYATQADITKKIGKSPSWVSRKLNDPSEGSAKTLAAFAGNYNKRILIALVKPGTEGLLKQSVHALEHRFTEQIMNNFSDRKMSDDCVDGNSNFIPNEALNASIR